MKRILYLHAGAEMYGADKVLLELIKRLDKTEFEAHVILPNDGVLVEALRQVGAHVDVIPYPILRRKYFNPKGILDYTTSYRRFSKKLVDYARNHKIDVIHNNTTAVLEGIYLKKKLGIPLIWHVHEIIVKPKQISDFINFLMGRYANQIVTVSQAVADHVLKSKSIKSEQVQVIYNGVDNEIYKPMDGGKIREHFGIAQEQTVIGMIGRVNAWKGQGDFLEAVLPLLQEDKKRLAFLAGSAFEGEEWRVEELDAAIADSGYADQIKRIDYYDKPQELYNLFDLFVLPSTNPDPLPTVVLEAMASGKPVVGYRHGGVCEMVAEGQNGLLAQPRNPAMLSELMKELLENPDKLAAFGETSLKRQLEQFSLQSYIGNFSTLYREIGNER
ncbi:MULTISPECIES: glycosyltransferase family 4 protein [unclassified Streptococcus]|uniref:glycosyltransferase family 4 protein n=1 Tax=unclassified Streptococcus TaxID=2608887 RepID=UPI001072182C|nr:MULTISPECIES: glycosyltransferase family 4 protein [unclassified Streptococcus]MBF0806150.1 glycosyltransferase family 4 protein [Streptococcus sp. 19428wA2_WM07]TFU28261.1 glycosyltransferase family 1 protein [Streptococcus sp. WM07]